MTLCIAAICDNVVGKESKIVLCADLERESEGVGSSETEDKLGFVKKGWRALIAGTIIRANELLNVYAGYLNEHFKDIDEFNLAENLRKPAHLQKKKLVDEYLQQTYAFDRDYFYGEGATKLPGTFISKVTADIERIKLDASLIIVGFNNETDFSTGSVWNVPFLSLVDESQSALGILESEYAAIGSGNYTALATLYRREQSSTDSLEETLYNVYEANRLSEEVPGVGKNFLAMYVLHENGKMKEVTDAGYKHLRNLYATYGPHDIKKREALTVRDEFFEDL
jgi:hypothetical protein